MSSVEYLREFVNERLTAAAEEIFGVFQKTIVEYEEEITRQRRLLDTVKKPEIKLHTTELPQQHVCKEEEVLADQQLCIQERNSSLDQEDPEPPQIKEEQEEICTSQEGEQLVLKQETETFMVVYEESDHSEDQILYLSTDEAQIVVEETPLSFLPVISSVVSEAHNVQQLLSHNSHVAESQDQNHEDSGSTSNAEPETQKRHHKSNTDNVHNSTVSTIDSNTHSDEKPFKCDTCGKTFRYRSDWQRHLVVHTGEKPYFCFTCGKRFCRASDLRTHITIHTGVRPYVCKLCGKDFRLSSIFKSHMRIHTGEKPYTCKTCGKAFRCSGDMVVHVRRTHTGMPFHCDSCGKGFCKAYELAKHIKLQSIQAEATTHNISPQ